MRRYELMLVLRPDLADDKVQAALERTARAIAAGGGQIVKQAPWGRRRLAYPIDHHLEGSYYVILFEAPATAIAVIPIARNIGSPYSKESADMFFA